MEKNLGNIYGTSIFADLYCFIESTVTFREYPSNTFIQQNPHTVSTTTIAVAEYSTRGAGLHASF